MKKKLIFLAVLLSVHVGSATGQTSDAVQGTADGAAAADSMHSLGWQLAIMAGGGLVGGAFARNGLTSGSEWWAWGGLEPSRGSEPGNPHRSEVAVFTVRRATRYVEGWEKPVTATRA